MSLVTNSLACDDRAAQARWQSLWEASPQRTAFASLAYVLHAAETYGLQSRMHLVHRDGVDEAGIIALWRRKLTGKTVVQPPLTQYSALLLRHPAAEAAVHRRTAPLEHLLRALEKAYARVHLFAHLSDPRPAQWRRWRVSPLFTYCLVPGADTAAWSEATRRAFRKHRAAFEVTESPASATDIIGLCQQSYARHGRKLPAPVARVQGLIKGLADNVRCFVAQRPGTAAPEAGLAVLHDGHTAHYWIAGSTPGPSMTVLIGQVLLRLRADGITSFDFVGANTPSIAEFKRHFGPRLIPYYAFAWRT